MPAAERSPVPLPASLLDRYARFSCYNSPYPAHDRGCAVDLYPDDGTAPAPVPGEVVATRTVACPDRPYAVDEDHLIVLDVADDWAGGRGAALLARVLHVDPGVDAGDWVAAGDSLGESVRSGFFGRWVDDHLHLGFRPAEANPYRASGSLPVVPDVSVAGAQWDGTGEVTETGQTYVRLDAPAHPDPGSWAALAADDGTPLDGGLAHYSGGGAYPNRGVDDDAATGQVSLLGTEVGTATSRAGRGTDVDWAELAVRVDGERATGLSLFASRDALGAKIVFHEGHAFAVGDEVAVTVAPAESSIRLG
ncbi:MULTISPECIES: hypothetical protein [Halolamina]|uniref:Peptidase family M23 n=1 Tax=Halolamina pelagica TaxID=699431 RepID=A0A1I5UED6_9EURY|nr:MULTISPECIES: hypothetical protein [Halolamina]NHX37240.1 hypothetical protein [Halolamina sp. R1-12]SFP93377.1 hypothetical protein SAMN05216277_11269 [Halolamina pelagica]